MLAGDEEGLRTRIYRARDDVFGGKGSTAGRTSLSSLSCTSTSLPPRSPIFRGWIGVAEYLFRSLAWLDATLHDVLHRSNDPVFVVAGRGWNQRVEFGSFKFCKRWFMKTAEFLQPRFEDATKVESAMIQAIMEDA